MTSSIASANFNISPSYQIPESLRQLIYQTWQNHYEELYEEEADGKITLEDTLSQLLDALKDEDKSLTHYRYLCMAIILALAVQPTVKVYLPENDMTEKVFDLVINWFETKKIPQAQQFNELFSQPSWGNQAIDEAMDVFKNLLQALNCSQAKEGLLEILDDCLEGYAIFPGSEGRRKLFDWCLLEVFPAVYCLEFPQSIYTIKGIAPLKQNEIIIEQGTLQINKYLRQIREKSLQIL